jgi:hypothetical protein
MMTSQFKKYQEASGFSSRSRVRLQRLEQHHQDLETALAGLEALIEQRFAGLGLHSPGGPRSVGPDDQVVGNVGAGNGISVGDRPAQNPRRRPR